MTLYLELIWLVGVTLVSSRFLPEWHSHTQRKLLGWLLFNKSLHLLANSANRKYADFFQAAAAAAVAVGERLLSALWRGCVLFASRSFLFTQVGVTFACDLILPAEMFHSVTGTCWGFFLSSFLSFSQAPLTVHFQKRDMLNLTPLCSASLSPTQTTCARSPSLNDSVNVPHQPMSHSTTLLLWWWFLPSVYYIMQQRVLLGYIHHNKHTASGSFHSDQIRQPRVENITLSIYQVVLPLVTFTLALPKTGTFSPKGGYTADIKIV